MSVYKKVGAASLIMMASVLLSRVIGLVREMTIAWAAGAGGSVDAYQVAFVIPEILNHVVASGFLSITFIPIFTRYLAENRESEGWEVFSLIMTGFGGLLILLIILSSVFAPGLVDLIAPGLTDPHLKADAVRMTRIILPAQFFFFAGGLLMAVQYARERFAIPALAPLIYNIGIIAGGLFLSRHIGMEGFSWGVLAGAFAGLFVLQLWGALKVGMKFSLRVNLGHPDLKKYVLLSLPLMIGLTMNFSTEFFFKFFGSYLTEGSIAALNYGMRVMWMLVGFFGQAVGVAAFPFMARLAAEGKTDEMNRVLNMALRYLSVVIPFSVLFVILRHEIVLILFQRGRFDAQATALTAHILGYLLAGTVAFAAQTVVVRGYYAMQNTLFPAIYGTLAVALSIPFYAYGMKIMGPAGVALAVSVSAMFQVILLYLLWNRRSGNAESREVYKTFLKMSLLSGIIGLILEGIKTCLLSYIDASGFLGSVITAAIIGAVFTALLIPGGHLLGIAELADTIQKIADRVPFFKKIMRKKTPRHRE
jgi:putative peptidoglycan lipid II flippase